MRPTPLLVSFLLAVIGIACAPEAPAELVAGESAAIINGTRERERDYVVAVVRISGGGAILGLCSGTAITNRHILTAKHCLYNEEPDGTHTALPASSFAVLTGHDVTRATGSFAVDQIHTTPGVYTDVQASEGLDIAIVRTAGNHGAPTREVARAHPMPTNRITMVGFGRTNSSSSASGRKFVGTARVREVFRGLFSSRGSAWTCQGDSGGPALDRANRVLGVTSFGLTEDCTENEVYFTDVAHNLAFIEGVIGTAPCTAREETCNGADDDCNAVVDEGCGEPGETCFSNDECISGNCQLVGGEPVCVQDCTPASGEVLCPEGMVCRATGCDVGECVAGAPGPGDMDAPCTDDGDCATNFCYLGEDGTRFCAQQCREGGGDCRDGRVCVHGTLSCGACELPAPGEPLPFGSDCVEDAGCIENICRAGSCTRACAADVDCPMNHRCSSGVCVFGTASGPGEPCADALDCSDTAPICAEVDGEYLCVAECPTGACADDTVCSGGLCLPAGLDLGETCNASDECRSNICAGNLCTRICDASMACPSGFECIPAGDVSGCFRPAAPPTDGGGCAVSSPGVEGALPAASLAVVLLFAFSRRRGS